MIPEKTPKKFLIEMKTMINKTLKIQYEIMTEENINQYGEYVPTFETLIAEAPNSEMAAKWEECRERLNKWAITDPQFSGFAFNSVYMVQKSCGHYEIFQHHTNSEEELLDWIERVELPRNNKCTRCICG